MTATLQTRTSTQPFKRTDRGYGWGRVCTEPGCGTVLSHFNPGKACALCETQNNEREIREATTGERRN